MYLLGYDEDVFREIESESLAFAGKLDVADLTIIPISALNGDNVVARSENMPWYDGTSLLHHLENVYIGSDRELRDVRFRSEERRVGKECTTRGWRQQEDAHKQK